MDQQIQGSNLRLVRNVIGCSEENVETAPGATIGDLLQLLAAKHCDRIQQNVFRCNDLNIEINSSSATTKIRRDLVHGIRGQLNKRESSG